MDQQSHRALAYDSSPPPADQQLATQRSRSLVMRLCWFCVLMFHIANGLYFALSACLYWYSPSSEFGMYLIFYGIVKDLSFFPLVAVFHGICAIVHAVGGLLMVAGSLAARRLQWSIKIAKNSSAYVMPKLDAVVLGWLERSSPRGSKLLNWFKRFSIHGPDFEWSLLAQEAIEIAFQTMQAYKLSRWAARPWLTPFYSALLVVNCVSTTIIQHIFRRDVNAQRALAIAIDTCIDFVSVVGIPIAMAVPYLEVYDWQTNEFQFFVWFHDAWFIRILNEFRIIVFTSWVDVASTFFFSIGTILGVRVIKKAFPLPQTVETTRPSVTTELKPAPSTKTSKYKRLVHILFVCWGLVITGIQLHAVSYPSLDSCPFQVRPWLATRPSCSLVRINCQRSELQGHADEMTQALQPFDPDLIAFLVFRHCPALEMPSTIQTFSSLGVLKVYNSTIVNWNESASLTNAFHPSMYALFLICVNFTNEMLPPGLLSSDFPDLLVDVELAKTNLIELPDNLNTKWSSGMSLAFDYGRFTSVPPVVLRMQPMYLSFVGNPLTSVPAELFSNELARTVWLNDIPTLTALPPVLPGPLAPSLYRVCIDFTGIPTLPSWITADFFTSEHYLRAGGSPFCNDIQNASIVVQKAYDNGWIDCTEYHGDDLTYYMFELEPQQE